MFFLLRRALETLSSQKFAAALVVGLWWLPCLVVVLCFGVLWLGVGCCL